jgi:hypothetical protein
VNVELEQARFGKPTTVSRVYYSTFLFGCEAPPFRTTPSADDDVAEDWIFLEFASGVTPIEGPKFRSAPYRLTGHYTGKRYDPPQPQQRAASAPKADCPRSAPVFRVTDWCVVLPLAEKTAPMTLGSGMDAKVAGATPCSDVRVSFSGDRVELIPVPTSPKR